MGLPNALRYIIRLICKDDLAAAIQAIRHLIKNSKELDAVILRSTRYREIKRRIREGRMDFEIENITRNKIRVVLLDIVREMEDVMDENPKAKALVEQDIAGITPIAQVTNDRSLGELILGSNEKPKEALTAHGNIGITDFFEKQVNVKWLLAGSLGIVLLLFFFSDYSSPLFNFNKNDVSLDLQKRAVSGYEEIQSTEPSDLEEEEEETQLEENKELISELNALEDTEEKNNIQLNKSPTKGKETLKVIKRTSLRASPKSSSKVLKRLNKGDSVVVLKKTNKYWWRVRVDEKVGYIKALLLE